MTNQLHLAAQYLAAAGISFLEKKDDDSHTNLGFSTENAILSTRKLGDKEIRLCLNYNLFTLEWKGTDISNLLKLDGTSHAEIVQWIQQMAHQYGLGTYSYDLHYDLPYKIHEDYTFTLQDKHQLETLKKHRILANTVIQRFLNDNHLSSEIRIWPHHFDTGAFTPLEDESGLAIGLGMAIPDTMIDDYYFYISAYQGHDGIDTSNFAALTEGEWKNEGFKGAVLAISDIDHTTGVRFFNEAFQAYKN